MKTRRHSWSSIPRQRLVTPPIANDNEECSKHLRSRRWLVTPPGECRWIAVQNGLIDPVTLNFNLLTPKAYHFELSSISLYQVWTVRDHLFLSYAAYKQTDKLTDGTKRSTQPTPTDRVGVGNEWCMIHNIDYSRIKRVEAKSVLRVHKMQQSVTRVYHIHLSLASSPLFPVTMVWRIQY